jgi:methionyl-tRNA formyltransferase
MKIIFAGTPANAAQALELVSQSHQVVLVLTREDAEVGRKRVLTPSPVAQVAESLGLRIHKTSKLRDEDLRAIADAGADLALVVAYGAMIPEAGLNLLPWWNLHFSLLPMWRGATPLQHSILQGTKAGVTLFELDKGLDTGKLVAQQELELGENETSGEALPRFTAVGIEIFNHACTTKAELKPQVGEASYAPKLSRSDARLDFKKTAGELHRAVMAFNPEPMAWCEWEGNPIRLIETRSLGSTNWVVDDLRPGRVSLSGAKVLLECAEGTQLEIRKIQPAGKNVMVAGDWFRGVNKEVLFG